jgi:zona occludens toxin
MLEDYGSEWRGDGGIGPLYVIDECHKPFPKGMTARTVEEWFAEHRHEGADCLLITQAYGKISQSIRDMVQVVYRVRKATALGSDKRYIRKVQDGLRGEVLNENIRSYNPKRFPLYKSHTKNNTAISEASASDIKPIWKHWSVIGAFVLIIVGLISVSFTAGDMFFPDPEPVAASAPEPYTYVPHNLRGDPKSVSAPVPVVASVPVVVPDPVEITHPFSGLGLHIAAYIHSDKKTLYSISASQNGQRVFRMSDSELRDAGYKTEFITPCLIKLNFKEYQDFITCDSPRQSVPVS